MTGTDHGRIGLLVVLVVAVTGLLVLAAGPGAWDDGPEADDPGPGENDSASNPWGEATLTVAVENEASPWRNVTGLVAGSLAYWERNADEYAAYEVGFDLRPDAEEPDVVVRFVEDVGACGARSGGESVGYAPVIDEGSPPDPPEEVCVRAGYADHSTRRILDHEFGHVLGIRHGEAPLPLMSTDYDHLRIPRPGPDVRAYDPPNRTLSVHLDLEGIHAWREHRARRGIEGALDYYERGAEGTLEAPVEFETVEDPDAADVVISFPRQPACGDGMWATCGRVVRRDGDPRLELAFTGVHEDAVGWHVGVWLGYALDAERHGDLAPPFRNATYEQRLSDWWAVENGTERRVGTDRRSRPNISGDRDRPDTPALRPDFRPIARRGVPMRDIAGPPTAGT